MVNNRIDETTKRREYKRIMKTLKLYVLISFMISVPFTGCNDSKINKEADMSLFDKKNLVAWCIIPFDAMNRTPEERIEMLIELGINRLAYDWRKEHLPDFPGEIELLRSHNIELTAVWLWIDEHVVDGTPEEINYIFDVLAETNTRTSIWAGFSDNFYEDKPDEVKLKTGVQIVERLREKAAETESSIALYNHGGWFGEPENQIRIIESIGSGDIGLVYNFHHGHHHIGHFPELLSAMLPYLWTVNINGMKSDGPKIVPLGQGDHEKEMIHSLMQSAFDGTIGILGHTEGEDIKEVLIRNIDGLQSILQELDATEALKTYR